MPIAAITTTGTVAPSASPRRTRTTLATEVPRGREHGAHGVGAPHLPRVAAARGEEAVADAVLLEGGGEVRVLLLDPLVVAGVGVQPDERVRSEERRVGK